MAENVEQNALAREISAYWDERAETYSNGVRGELSDSRKAAWQRELAGLVAGAFEVAYREGRIPRALDLGCGPGFFSTLLAEGGWQVDAVDVSADMLARARANVAEAALDSRVFFHQGDIARLPFPDASFDVAVSRNVTWLMREPRAAYAEWLRVLRPGGKLLVFDANWYRYLVDPQVNERRLADQAGNVLEGWDEDAQANSDEERRCEEIAASLPLTPVLRPEWDVETLGELGASKVRADVDAWLRVWPESEQRYYGSTPMFLVEAVK